MLWSLELSRMRRQRQRLLKRPLRPLHLVINRLDDRQQPIPAGRRGERKAEPLIDPVERGDVSFPHEAVGGLPLLAVTQIKRQARAVIVVIHQLRRSAAVDAGSSLPPISRNPNAVRSGALLGWPSRLDSHSTRWSPSVALTSTG